MPSTDYTWLSNREQQYLDDPDAFDNQTAAEIRYRLRGKYAATVDVLNRLLGCPETWDVRDRFGETTVTCSSCGATCEVRRYCYRETGKTTIRKPAGWRGVDDDAAWGKVDREGLCRECWRAYRDG